MNILRVDPVRDPRWNAFVHAHPDAAVFHTGLWLDALERTYKYQPIAYAIADGDRLVSAIPFCRVKSFLTGSRLVSLPFSDHCQPLIGHPDHFTELISAANNDASRDGMKYVELRPLVFPANSPPESGGVPSEARRGGSLQPILTPPNLGGELCTTDSVVVHKLDISRGKEELLRSFHADCIRRKIAKAEREELELEEGRSEDLLGKFYGLLLMTRRRHGIPPQPLAWFRNLIACLGESLTISVASKSGKPIASILTISFKHTLVYKYGCSDPEYNALAGSIFLLWQAILRGKQLGKTEFDLGRSDYDTPGLITFKDRWGAARISVNYYRSGKTAAAPRGMRSRFASAAKRLLLTVPDPMFRALGGLLYRHVG
jgi:CelD/BcsL family acetyltransferase involved in cellulose biosynthesis